MHASTLSLTNTSLMNDLSHRSVESETSKKVFQPTSTNRATSDNSKTELTPSRQISTRYYILYFMHSFLSLPCLSMLLSSVKIKTINNFTQV